MVQIRQSKYSIGRANPPNMIDSVVRLTLSKCQRLLLSAMELLDFSFCSMYDTESGRTDRGLFFLELWLFLGHLVLAVALYQLFSLFCETINF